MTKEDFIKKYIYGIGNDALTDNQEAIDMAKDLDRYFTEQLRKHAVNSSVCPCNELPDGEIAISSKALQKPYGDLGQADC